MPLLKTMTGSCGSRPLLQGLVFVSAALLALQVGATGLAVNDKDEGSITLGASIVKPYQYSGDAKEFTVAPARTADAAAGEKAQPAEAAPEAGAGGKDAAHRL